MSSMCPSIIVDANGDVQLSIGAAGGTKITTAVAQTIMRLRFLGERLFDVITGKRVHHQLLPMLVQYESGLEQWILDGLKARGHGLQELSNTPFGAVGGIYFKNGNYEALYDNRRWGGGSEIQWLPVFNRRLL